MRTRKRVQYFVLLASILGLLACELLPFPAQPTSTTVPTTAPTVVRPTNMSALELTDTARSKDTSAPAAGLKCIGAVSGGGHPPEHTKDLKILTTMPLDKYDEVVSYFSQFARECDGLGILGRYADLVNWQDVTGELPKGIVFYHLPSLEYGRLTADQWTDDVDSLSYEITFSDRTPDDEQNNPAQASRMALEFAREHGLVYMVAPGSPVTRRHAAEVAQYADIYVLQSQRLARESPETFIQLVKDTSQKIRAVKPDILMYVVFSTDQPEDDPQVTYDLITSLMGYIDGVAIRTSAHPKAVEKLKTLVSLLREE